MEEEDLVLALEVLKSNGIHIMGLGFEDVGFNG
jgi:hypothetical protein